jgi:hypothetical protein
MKSLEPLQRFPCLKAIEIALIHGSEARSSMLNTISLYVGQLFVKPNILAA